MKKAETSLRAKVLYRKLNPLKLSVIKLIKKMEMPLNKDSFLKRKLIEFMKPRKELWDPSDEWFNYRPVMTKGTEMIEVQMRKYRLCLKGK